MSQHNPVRKKLGILVVEDSDVLREMFHRTFHDIHQVYATSGAKEGWELYVNHAPDIVFLDIGLPDGSGHDLASMIKERNPATYVVMATASHHIGDKKAAAQNHVDGFVTKPFNKQEINGYIDQYLAHSQRKS